MTRTKPHNSTAAVAGERHFNRSGYQDPRRLPKKEGAGGFNWGRPSDELDIVGDTDATDGYPWEEYDDEHPTRKRASSDVKLSTIDSKLFESLHNH
ncbi:hypothetical protein K7432_008681 [Basidiobolus ranarum]|uniref:Hyaluronan/mRNA-binding protein domain-containing protein n=1 Tax=Basidiobolus ranarum TaxID=34480 RepID=A0ABR2VYA2_9FUNG